MLDLLYTKINVLQPQDKLLCYKSSKWRLKTEMIEWVTQASFCSGHSIFPVFRLLQKAPLPNIFSMPRFTSLQDKNFHSPHMDSSARLYMISCPHLIIAYLTLVASIKGFSNVRFPPCFQAFGCLPLLDQWLLQHRECRGAGKDSWVADISQITFLTASLQ